MGFNRDIRPIFSEYCTACHGPDARRQSRLAAQYEGRLLEKTAKRGPAIVAGNLEKSELWQRVITTDEDDIMPPGFAQEAQAGGEGEAAPMDSHGRTVAGSLGVGEAEKPAVPSVKAGGFKVRNPIDAFVLAKLQSKGLKPAAEADHTARWRTGCPSISPAFRRSRKSLKRS